ncbi:MAG: hypothetical protein ACTHLR_09945 [Rhizomicrobium sp.]
MNRQLRNFGLAVLGMCGLAVTSAYAYDVTELRDSPAAEAPNRLQSQGFRFVGTYSDFDNEWKMWFNRHTGECVGYTQKGRQVKRARSFGNDRCRSADRGGFDHRPDYYDGGGYHGGDRDGVPGWMVGYFRGYNRSYGADVSLDISPDGNVVATVNGRRSYGEFRRGKLRIGVNWYFVDRDPGGLVTRQMGNEDNVVHYRRR